MFDISGWVSKIQAYAISNHTPTQKSHTVPTQNLHIDHAQNLGTNKHQNKKEETMTGYEKFKKARKNMGYN